MKISTKGIYGLMVMLDISLQKTKVVSLNDISKRLGLSYKYLEQVIKLLKDSNLLLSKKGKNGGYYLAKDVKKISVLEILNALIGELSFVGCADDEEFCNRSGFCITHNLWSFLYVELNNQANEISLYDLKKCFISQESEER